MVKALEDYSPGARSIILTAERLFGEHGLNGVSLRQILAEAGQANSSAVQHHFGSKAGLINAAYQTREQTIEAARKIALDRLGDADRAVPERLLRAWLLPILETLSEDERLIYARFMLQLNPLGDHEHPYFKNLQFSPASVELTRRIKVCMPELPPEVFHTRLRIASSVFLEGIRNEQRVRVMKSNPYGSLSQFWDEIFQMALAAIEVPYPPRPVTADVGLRRSDFGPLDAVGPTAERHARQRPA